MDATEDLESVVRAADGPLLTCGEIRHRLRYHLLLGDGVLEHLGGDFRSLHCFLDEIGLHPSRRNLEHSDAEALDLQTEAFGIGVHESLRSGVHIELFQRKIGGSGADLDDAGTLLHVGDAMVRDVDQCGDVQPYHGTGLFDRDLP